MQHKIPIVASMAILLAAWQSWLFAVCFKKCPEAQRFLPSTSKTTVLAAILMMVATHLQALLAALSLTSVIFPGAVASFLAYWELASKIPLNPFSLIGLSLSFKWAPQLLTQSIQFAQA